MRKLYRLAEVLEMLPLSRTEAYREMKDGRLAYIQAGNRRLFEPEAVDAYVASLKGAVGVDRLVELIDVDGRIEVSAIPTGTSLADLVAAKRIVAERVPVA